MRAARVRARAAAEAGFSLVELLIVTTLLAVLLSAILGALDLTNRLAPKDQERTDVIQETQAGVTRMVRELRLAYRVDTATQWAVQVRVMRNGQLLTVNYNCAAADPNPQKPNYRRCMRTQTGPGGTGAAVPVITRIPAPPNGAPAPVFTYATNAAGNINRINVNLSVSATGDLKKGYEHAISLSDGVLLRNVDSCGPQTPTACP
jgi:prepilin-type N-terminal cleavage/methylation domain-containing protein